VTDRSDSSTRQPGLAAFAGINALAAWGGAIGLLSGALSFGDEVDRRLPFDSLVVAGLALAVVIAIPLSVLAVAAWTGHPNTGTLSTAVGATLIAWILLQMAVLHAFSWLHPLYLFIGTVFVVIGVGPGHRQQAIGVAGIVMGALLVATGTGLLPRLLEAELIGVVAFGLVLGGLSLAVVGGRALLRRRQRPAQVGGGVAIGLLVAVTVWLVSPSIAATNVPATDLGATPADRGLTATDVLITTADGVQLAGWDLPSENGAAVVLLHGAGSTRSNVLDQAAVIHRHGYGILMIDARGHGESGGRAMDFGWYGDLDVAAATRHLVEQDGIDADRIGAVGMSMGGEEAIGAAASDPFISAVVAEGATGRTAADKRWLSDEYGWRGAAQEQIEKAQFWVTDYLSPAAPPTALRSAVANSGDTPFLLIAAGDVADETAAGTYIASAAPDRVTVWTVEGASHTGGLDTAPGEWERQVMGFLDQHLDGER
jgi:pimeloyl-ACP methyl ester carboxylesterase